jgi:hypothetical protein
MPRNRIIKHDFWADEKTGELSLGARLMFIGSWNFADDIGVFRGNLAYLKANIFPYDSEISIKEIDLYCKELTKSGLVISGKFNDENYFLIKNFSKHQKINRPSDFRFVSGSDKHNILELFNSVSTHDTLMTYSLTKVKEKEKEKEKENVKEAYASAQSSHRSFCDEILDAWNRNAPEHNLPTVKLLNPTRMKKLQSALKDFNKIDDWLKIFSVASTKGFTGKDGREFIPNWDYVFRNNNYVSFYDEYEVIFNSKKENCNLQKQVEQSLINSLMV